MKTSKLILAGMVNFLMACGGPGQFHADDYSSSLQPESTFPIETSPPAGDAAERMKRGDDSQTRARDPIFQDQARRTPPPSGGAPATSTQPAAPAPSSTTSYNLPENTFATVRVRLFPLTSSRHGDVYLATRNKNNLRLSNSAGLVVRDLSERSTFSQTGRALEFRFDRQLLVMDGTEYPLANTANLGIFPVNRDQHTLISLDLNAGRARTQGLGPYDGTGIPFRGIFALRKAESQAESASPWALINYVLLEDYILSVLPSEIGTHFHAEARKAQAIAARTFALRHMTSSRCLNTTATCEPRDWDVDPTTLFQAYLGSAKERPETSVSAGETRGKYLNFAGAPALTMYHSSSGGRTRAIQDFRCRRSPQPELCHQDSQENYPYLTAVDDPLNGQRARFGHGVGLPQYSAQAMALAGSSVQQIMEKYYPGTLLEEISVGAP